MRRLSPLLLALAACGAPPEPPTRTSQLQAIAGEYEKYGLVDDLYRQATPLCRMPSPPEPRLSSAGEGSPHGRKLYHLYAKDWDAYSRKGVQPIGQVIVKEAWEPVPGDKGPMPGPKQGLYVMMKVAAEAVDSDAGWVYGTLLPDGKTVTGRGRMPTCMGCHREAPEDRIFGLPKAQ